MILKSMCCVERLALRVTLTCCRYTGAQFERATLPPPNEVVLNAAEREIAKLSDVEKPLAKALTPLADEVGW